MNRLEMLVNYAHNQAIKIFNTYSPSRMKGCCLVNDNGAAIMINKRAVENSRCELCILAEEVGHLETGSTLPFGDYLSPKYKRWLKVKNEIHAKRWAIKELLPFNDIQSAINRGCDTDYEIVKELGVTHEFFGQAVEYYHGQGMYLQERA